MSETIRSLRKAQGISVSELAARLRVTPGAISQMERSEREGTIKLRTLEGALSALDRQLVVTAAERHPLSGYSPTKLAESLSRAIDAGDETFALRLLTEATQAIRMRPNEISREELETAPPPLPDARWDQFFRAQYREAISGAHKPAWTATRKLPEPWFISKYPLLQKRAVETTPDHLRRLNIFIEERSLSRA